jgi:hypothetical protein
MRRRCDPSFGLTATEVYGRNTGVTLHALPLAKLRVPIVIAVAFVLVIAFSAVLKALHTPARVDVRRESRSLPFSTCAVARPAMYDRGCPPL